MGRAAWTLQRLAKKKDLRFAIAEAGAVECLATLLQSPVDGVRWHAAGALHNLAASAELTARIAGCALSSLVSLLTHSTGETRCAAAGALRNLSKNLDLANYLLDGGALTPLVCLLDGGSLKAREVAAGTICNLSKRCELRNRICAAGVIPALEALLVDTRSSDVEATVSETLRQLGRPRRCAPS